MKKLIHLAIVNILLLAVISLPTIAISETVTEEAIATHEEVERIEEPRKDGNELAEQKTALSAEDVAAKEENAIIVPPESSSSTSVSTNEKKTDDTKKNDNTFSNDIQEKRNFNTREISSFRNESIDSWMPDKVLQQAVAARLGVTISEITKDNILSLDTLNTRGISDLTGIEYARNLSSLVVNGGTIADITAISQLTKLTNVQFPDNNITDIGSISGLTNLQTFSASGNKIVAIPNLSQLTRLQSLNLNKNAIKDISPLSVINRAATINIVGQIIAEDRIVSIDYPTGSLGLLENSFVNVDGTKMAPTLISPASVIYDGINFKFSTELTARIEFNTSKNTNGLIISYSAIYNVVAKRKIRIVNVRYYDEHNNELTESQWIEGYRWDAYDGSTPEYKIEVPGYHIDESRLPQNATGIIGNSAIKIDYYYIKDKTAIFGFDSVIYVGDAWSNEDNFEKAIDKYGNEVSFGDVKVEGNVDTIIPGEYEITYHFAEVSTTIKVQVIAKKLVIVEYVDQAGKQLADNVFIKGKLEEKYTTEMRDIKGYTLQSIPENATGVFTDEDTVVTYVYQKITESTEPTELTEPTEPTEPTKLTESTESIKQEKLEKNSHKQKKELPLTGEAKKPIISMLGIVILISVAIYGYPQRKRKN